MMRTIIVPLLGASLLTEAAQAAPDFARDIRPILSETCFACHGQDARKRKAKLRLDQGESALAERDGVQAIVPGDLENSEAWIRITSKDEDEVMPPRDSHKQLSDAEKELLRQWILQGAQYQEH
ncbi:MAG: c-type cytochrome domain-containing protein, partial [Verrucomicrobiota bacterium]|nr:c-type cytochrome domain-containing protein [Verrucomicrobiota bacterium]